MSEGIGRDDADLFDAPSPGEGITSGAGSSAYRRDQDVAAVVGSDGQSQVEGETPGDDHDALARDADG